MTAWRKTWRNGKLGGAQIIWGGTTLDVQETDCDVCDTWWWVLKSIAEMSNDVLLHARVLYLKGELLDDACMVQLARVLRRYQNVFSLNIGEQTGSRICSGTWQFFAGEILFTGLVLIFVDVANGFDHRTC